MRQLQQVSPIVPIMTGGRTLCLTVRVCAAAEQNKVAVYTLIPCCWPASCRCSQVVVYRMYCMIQKPQCVCAEVRRFSCGTLLPLLYANRQQPDGEPEENRLNKSRQQIKKNCGLLHPVQWSGGRRECV